MNDAVPSILIVLALALIVGIWLSSRRPVLKSRLRSRVVVTTTADMAFAGVLFESDRTALVLRNAEAVGVGENRENVPVDGEVLILLADVAFIQRP